MFPTKTSDLELKIRKNVVTQPARVGLFWNGPYITMHGNMLPSQSIFGRHIHNPLKSLQIHDLVIFSFITYHIEPGF